MKRRTFLLACGSTAFAASAPSRLRIGQIGTEHAHAAGKMAAMRSLTDLWEVVGVAAKDKAYDGVPLLTEEQLLGTPGLKAVAVETRVEDSCATALRCIQAGKHVHLDKPGALKHDEFKSMRIEAEKRGLTVQMGYMLRYNPAFELLFQAVREGWLGEITEIDAAMGKLANGSTRGAIRKLEGGGMFELACHIIDATLTIMGKPASVTGFSTPTQDDGVKDNQMAVLQYAKATAVIRCNHTDPFGGLRRRFNVTGTEGTFEIVPLESGKVNLSLTKACGAYKKGTQSIQLDVPKDRYAGEFMDLAKVVRGEKKLAWDAAHDIAVHETVLRASGVWK
ncbi:MAG: Gfo/Idh/MocA family oxidoreductase [Prosthecobacter sp.]|jgi:predicted dehydrogenase|uniref:Gfo/Idh/MocA family protein n=1 Tax=Prosthecobacter sp. TaxID=1965333 RepID=UPI001A0AA552|nr:Gfo/Idh/MocA family oxidoreductase [Prosthecobacter sp.]MBE2282824.1 Gfo/Idh/MocA family oxidoreductase [Prosthecobacter sp.]